jgi:uncharacterized integral membrane protein
VKLVHWVATLPAVAAASVFAIGNLQPVALWPLPGDWPLPLGLVVVASLFVGFAVGELAAWIGGRRWRREARHRARRIAALEHELAATQARPDAAPPRPDGALAPAAGVGAR